MKKKESQRIHALRRSAERFGVGLGHKDSLGIVRDIQEGKARFVHRQSHRVSLWEIPYVDEKAVVAYDKKRKMVVTVIPAEEYYRNHPGRRPKAS